MSFLDNVHRWLAEPAPDHVFEISEAGLSAVSPRNPSHARQKTFEERLLVISPSAPNVVKPQLYREALSGFANAPSSKRSAALVIPDYAVRMAILDFETFPTTESERTALIRFRLRKTVPFPIDEAQVSYAVQLEHHGRIEVLAVAIARPILSEYETLFTDAGYRVGLVMPSSIAVLPLCYAADSGLTLLAKTAASTLSVLLIEQKRVRLVRCLDLAGETAGPATAREDVILTVLQQTTAYAEDQIGSRVSRVLLCGFGDETELLGRLAQDEFGTHYAAVRSRFGAVSQENAGMFGLLEQYAA